MVFRCLSAQLLEREVEVGVGGHGGFFGGVFDGGIAGDVKRAAGPGIDGRFGAREGELDAGGELGAEDLCAAILKPLGC